MPDKRTHRGPHPEDQKLFGPKQIPAVCRAVADFSLLLSKGYARKSSLKIVGDHFGLTQRQRLAVMRAACSDTHLSERLSRKVQPSELPGQSIVIDGYNLLITIEAALSSAPIFLCRDLCLRDLASIHGSYRKVEETIPAVKLVADVLGDIGIEAALWLFDSPVSNSGRLKTIITELAVQAGWPWQVRLLANPDAQLIKTEDIVASSDSDVLDKCSRWTNLAAMVIERLKSSTTTPKIIDLSNR